MENFVVVVNGTPNEMPQLILTNGEQHVDAPADREPDGIDVDFPDVLADLDVETLPDDVVEYARVRLGETEESRTKLLAELEDMIYGECDKDHLSVGRVRGLFRGAHRNPRPDALAFARAAEPYGTGGCARARDGPCASPTPAREPRSLA